MASVLEAQKLEDITPVVVTTQELETNKQLQNPGNIIIHVPELTSSNGNGNGNSACDSEDRQRQAEIDLKYKKRRLQHGKRYWMRRVLVGKDEHEEQSEKLNKKKRHFVKKEIRRHLAEFLGSFFIVFFIAGIQVNQNILPNGGVTNVDKGVLSGLLLSGLIYCFGSISGAHFNPVITLAFTLRGSFHFARAITYIAVQFGGAVVGAAVIQSLFGDDMTLGTTFPAPGITPKHAFGLEIVLTFLLVTVVLTTAVNAQVLGATSGLAVGSTFGAIELLGWNLSGASVNPWRTIGPTMISGFAWNSYWVYIVGPLVGMLFAVVINRVMVTGIKRESIQDIGHGDGRMGPKIIEQ